MPGLKPQTTAEIDQIRALGQEHLDGFIEQWHKEVAAGRDPSQIFAGLWNGAMLAVFNLGPESTVGMLCSAIERLARVDEPVL